MHFLPEKHLSLLLDEGNIKSPYCNMTCTFFDTGNGTTMKNYQKDRHNTKSCATGFLTPQNP